MENKALSQLVELATRYQETGKILAILPECTVQMIDPNGNDIVKFAEDLRNSFKDQVQRNVEAERADLLEKLISSLTVESPFQ